MKTRPHTNKALVVGEVLLILRPLLYVLLIRRYGLRSWLPWLLSLAFDATGMTVLYSTTVLPSYKVGNHLRPAATMSKLEKNEVIHHIFLCIEVIPIAIPVKAACEAQLICCYYK